MYTLYPNGKNPFEYQKPDELQVERLERVRLILKDAYQVIEENVEDGPTKTLAFRHLEQASMWANKAIVFE